METRAFSKSGSDVPSPEPDATGLPEKLQWHAPVLKQLDVALTLSGGGNSLEAGHDDPNKAS